MKKVIAVISFLLALYSVKGQNIGIGTNNPQALLHVADSNVVFTGAGIPIGDDPNPPISGIGFRMMWYAPRGAFRTGFVIDKNWNRDSTGYYSFAAGENPRAKGLASVATGSNTISSGSYSTATGLSTEAAGYSSFVAGMFNVPLVAPEGSVSSTTPLFIVGNGTGNGSRSNAMVVLKNGNVGIGTSAPTDMLDVNGTAGKPGGGLWAVFSDARLKQDVTPYTDGLAALLKINPVWYRYNDLSGYNTQPKYVGIIAQELQQAAPYMVSVSDKKMNNGTSGYLHVDNSAMTYMLINAVKEQQKEIEELKMLVKELLEKK